VTMRRFQDLGQSGLHTNQLIVSFRHDYEVTALDLAPNPPDSLFTINDLPPGATFRVTDENGELLSRAHESKDGRMIVTDEELAELRKAANNEKKR
jgi:hypothetical protein